MSFKILNHGAPRFVDGYPETLWSDGEPDIIEWELYCIQGDAEAIPGELLTWNDYLPHPDNRGTVPVFCNFQVKVIGSEGNLYGWGLAEWVGDVPHRRRYNDLPV